ncbi:alpha-amylase [Actinoplanes sp. Pm04-4]|uniref:Alpha-amylase n=1 Tax=Paractinoplanes pyxinae TaxID=2997416 RepID=A0ABT4AST4_9ACTN|nr:alpha-amylase [Actinoplanes pyxinae]MCY1136857.1 alpha-amylase [Actinoplanes pyxinae]
MTGWPAAPAVYEIDTWPWLTGLARRYGRPVTLGDVPGEVWDELSDFDAVWLMGVWERSPAGLAVAVADPGLRRDFHAALPGLSATDVVGSPYCVRRYEVDERLGGAPGLAVARSELARGGVRLILDYVPNHVAPDHPIVAGHPEWLVNGGEDDLAREPGAWFAAGGHVLARGRDPYFPPWPDVVQLNAFDPGLRQWTARTLAGIAEQCDGVRCDMAMLVTNEIFARTWGRWAGPAPAEEFWPAIIGEVGSGRDFVFVAEAYWDLEWALQQQGFGFCYDKRLYDRLVHEDADAVRKHLTAGRDYQDKLIRFTENHDEPRAATALPGGRGRAAAVAIATLPGATLWHDGQFEGRRTRLPVFLGRYPDEPVDEDLLAFHHRLARLKVDRGDWQLLECSGWPDNPSYQGVLAWSWRDGGDRRLVAVNFSDGPAQARVPVPWSSPGGRWRLTDLLDGRVFERDGDELSGPGLYVDLPPWNAHVLEARSLVH